MRKEFKKRLASLLHPELFPSVSPIVSCLDTMDNGIPTERSHLARPIIGPMDPLLNTSINSQEFHFFDFKKREQRSIEECSRRDVDVK